MTSAALFALATALEPALLRLIPPDAGFIAGVEWREILRSPSGAALDQRLRQAALPQVPALAALEKALREDVDSLVLIGSAPAISGGPRPQEGVLVVVRGRFDRDALRKWLPGKTEVYKKFELLAPAGAQPPTGRIVLLDAGTLVFGERKRVLAALDRLTAPSARVPARLVQRSSELAGQHHLWLALDAPPGGFPPDDDLPLPLANQLTGLDAGISLSRGLDLEANLQAATTEGARALAGALEQLVTTAARKDARQAELLRRLQIGLGPSEVHVRLSLSPEELARTMDRQRAPASSAALPAPAASSNPAGPKKIRILGLDEGPREVPVK